MANADHNSINGLNPENEGWLSRVGGLFGDTLRTPVSFILACLVTLFLFWLMQYLITPEEGLGKSAGPSARLELVTVTPEPPAPETAAAEAPAASAPPPPPSLPALSRPTAPKIKAAEFDIAVPDIDIPVQMPTASGVGSGFVGFAGGAGSGSGGGGGSGAYAGGGSGTKPLTPLSTARPQIPQYACEKGIEGWVEAVFVVGTNGKVSNVRIIDAEPKGLFEAAMVKSVMHWLYPRQKSAKEVTQRVPMLVEDCKYNW